MKYFSHIGWRELRFTIVVVFILGISIGSYALLNFTKKYDALSRAGEGIQTCYYRLAQTYTASILRGDSSPYLRYEFQQNTEKCFADVSVVLSIFSSDTVFKNQILTNLNKLMNNVYQFHENVNSKRKNNELGFQNIEKLKGLVLENNGRFLINFSKYVFKFKVIFIGMVFFTFLLLFIEYILLKRLKNSNSKKSLNSKNTSYEDNFSESKYDELDTVKIAETFKDVIYDKGVAESKEQKITSPKSVNSNENIKAFSHDKAKSIEISRELMSPDLEISNIAINEEKILNETFLVHSSNISTETSSFKSIHLELVLAKVIKYLSNEIFGKGIEFDVDVDENTYVLANEEGLEQVVYYLITNFIQKASGSEDESRISIKSRKDNDYIYIDFDVLNFAIPEWFFDEYCSLDMIKKHFGPGVRVSCEFVDSFGGKVSFYNVSTYESEVVGRVRILLKRSVKESNIDGKFIAIKKGTKKDILNSLSAAID